MKDRAAVVTFVVSVGKEKEGKEEGLLPREESTVRHCCGVEMIHMT